MGEDRHRQLGQILERQIVELPPFAEAAGRIEIVAPKSGAVSYANRPHGVLLREGFPLLRGLSWAGIVTKLVWLPLSGFTMLSQQIGMYQGVPCSCPQLFAAADRDHESGPVISSGRRIDGPWDGAIAKASIWGRSAST